MKFVILSFLLIMITCLERSTIVKSAKSFDSASFEPIIEHSQIPNDTGIASGFVDTLNIESGVSDSLIY